jgi:hypothetical protein
VSEQFQNTIEKYHTVGTVPRYNRKTKNTTVSEQFQKTIEKSKKEAKSIILTQIIIHRRSLSWLGTGTLLKSGGVKLK